MNADLSFALRQHSHKDPELIRAIVHEFYAPVTLLSAGLAPDSAQVHDLSLEVFMAVLKQLDKLGAGEEFYTWFLAAAVRHLRQRRSQNLTARPNQGLENFAGNTDRGRPPGGISNLTGWHALDRDAKIVLLLRLLMGVAPEDIVQILKWRDPKVLDVLNRAVLTLYPAADARRKHVHPGFGRMVWARGSLSKSDEKSLTAHLAHCPSCTAFAAALDDLQAIFHPAREQILDTLAAVEIDRFADTLLQEMAKQPARVWSGWPVKEISWILLAVPVFLGVGWLFSRAEAQAQVETALKASQLAAANQPVEDLPEVSADISISLEAQPETIIGPIVESSWSPKISEDGRWIVFASTIRRLVEDDTNETSDIFVYARETGVVERVSVNSRGGQANNGSFEPDISGDGRFVVYVSWANNLASEDTLHCDHWGTQSSCPDIFLHDRETGENRLVSSNAAGRPGNSFSFGPSISADGRWIAFWSYASDLVENDEELCTNREGTQNCLDVFLYDQIRGNMLRIPVGRHDLDPTPKNLDLILSGDGELLLLMIDRNDLIADEIAFNGAFDYVMYRPASGAFEPLVPSAGGLPGNEPAYAASVSSDGRWVAFATRASNLVEGDENGIIDVYVRDLQTGQIERVGQPLGDEESDGNSGVPAANGGGFSESLSISRDGRWVFFSSVARNLVQDQQPDECTFFIPVCQNAFLADRLTGQLEKINSTNIDWLSFASLSGDGRWMTFLAHSDRCNPNEYCSDIYLYDRETGSVGALDTFGIHQEEITPPTELIGGIRMLDLHETWNTSVAFSPDGDLLASGSRDGTVILWSMSEHERFGQLTGHAAGVNSLAFSPAGDSLAAGTGAGQIYFWRMPAGNLIGRIDNLVEVRDLVYLPGGDRLAVSIKEGVQLWDLEEDAVALTIGDSEMQPRGLAVSGDGAMLAVASDDGTVRIFEAETGQPLLRLGGHEAGANTVAFSPTGKMLATGGDDGRANVWRLERDTDGALKAELIYRFTHADWITALAFTADGSVLATGSYDSRAGVWDLNTGALIDIPFSSAQNQVLDLAISPDGQNLAIGTVRGEVVLWVELGQIGG